MQPLPSLCGTPSPCTRCLHPSLTFHPLQLLASLCCPTSRPEDARHLACACELKLSRVYVWVLNAYARVLNAVRLGVEGGGIKGVRVGVDITKKRGSNID